MRFVSTDCSRKPADQSVLVGTSGSWGGNSGHIKGSGSIHLPAYGLSHLVNNVGLPGGRKQLEKSGVLKRRSRPGSIYWRMEHYIRGCHLQALAGTGLNAPGVVGKVSAPVGAGNYATPVTYAEPDASTATD